MVNGACADPLELNKCYRFESASSEGEFMKHTNWEVWKKSGTGLENRKSSTWEVVAALNGDSKHISLKSLNHQSYHVSHHNFKGSLTKCSSNNQECKDNSSFAVKNGFMKSTFCDETVSFESYNFPGYFLRPVDDRLMISLYQRQDLYKKEASWVYHEVSCTNNFQCPA